MHRLIPAALITLATTAALAQTPTTFPLATENHTCPVGFSATRQPSTPQVMSADTQNQLGPAQGLHLSLNIGKTAIQSIRVTVYAVPPTLRALPLAQPADDTIAKSFDLNRQPNSDSLREADVWMHQVGSIRYVDLISITYTDGTAWHSTSDFQCRVTPSNFVLVTRR
jgi:hypothetical protein